MKALKLAGQTIEGLTWLLLHLLGHILLILGCVTALLNAGIEHSLGVIRASQDGLLRRLGDGK